MKVNWRKSSSYPKKFNGAPAEKSPTHPRQHHFHLQTLPLLITTTNHVKIHEHNLTMSQFKLGGDTGSSTPVSLSVAIPSTSSYNNSAINSSSVDSDDEDNLPYPADLARSDFLSPNFDPQTYLSTLRSRHQTLEDLRSDLRQRSQLLNQELLDLVNSNYEEFLSLGADLKGGEEKVEGVRVGLLGFEREIEAIKRGVEERLALVENLLEERRGVVRDVVIGRGLLEIDRGIEELEVALGVKDAVEEAAESGFDVDSEEDEDEAEGAGGALNVPVRKLRRHVQQYLLLSRSIQRLGAEHPFLVAQRLRMAEIKRTLLLDLSTSLKQAKAAKDHDSTLAFTRMFADIGSEQEGVKALKAG